MHKLSTLPPKAAGEAAELAFMARAAALGLAISKPLGDSASYDVILGSCGRLLRVQVKSVSTLDRKRGPHPCPPVFGGQGGDFRSGAPHLPASGRCGSVRAPLPPGRYSVTASRGSRKRPYDPGEIDFLAACVTPLNAWYIIPISAIGSRVGIHLYPHRPNSGLFEQFRERWDLLQYALR
jgi:hypothetical protein